MRKIASIPFMLVGSIVAIDCGGSAFVPSLGTGDASVEAGGDVTTGGSTSGSSGSATSGGSSSGSGSGASSGGPSGGSREQLGLCELRQCEQLGLGELEWVEELGLGELRRFD